MKNLYLRSCVALACALSLGGCGGDEADLLLQVRSITNLTKEGLTLSLNGAAPRPVAANSQFFNFPELVARDSSFEIKIVGQPPNATCEIFDGKGKTGAISPQTIRIVCTLVTYDLGGTIEGLALNEKLILNNGSVRKEFTGTATSPINFNLTTTAADNTVTGKVPEDFSYGVTVFQAPAGKTCSVTNGTGTMPARAVTNIAVKCV